MNRCRPERIDMNEYGEMLKLILKIKEGRVPDKNARRWKREKQKSHEESVQD